MFEGLLHILATIAYISIFDARTHTHAHSSIGYCSEEDGYNQYCTWINQNAVTLEHLEIIQSAIPVNRVSIFAK